MASGIYWNGMPYGTASDYCNQMQRQQAIQSMQNASQFYNTSSIQVGWIDEINPPKPKNNKITDEGLLNNLRREINEWINF